MGNGWVSVGVGMYTYMYVCVVDVVYTDVHRKL